MYCLPCWVTLAILMSIYGVRLCHSNWSHHNSASGSSAQLPTNQGRSQDLVSRGGGALVQTRKSEGSKGVVGKKISGGADPFRGGGRNPQNLKFRANHRGPPCELFVGPRIDRGGRGRPPCLIPLMPGQEPSRLEREWQSERVSQCFKSLRFCENLHNPPFDAGA